MNKRKQQQITKQNALTHDRLLSLLSYDETSGEFWWKERGLGRVMNKPVGTRHEPSGYHILNLCWTKYLAHRVAWFYVYGVWPKDQLDHIDGNKLNNRIDNLRECDTKQNSHWYHDNYAPAKSNTGIKYIGEWYQKKTVKGKTYQYKYYKVRIRGRKVTLHKTLDEAIAVRDDYLRTS